MVSITFQFNESARVRVCLMLMALAFLGVGLSTVYLVAVRSLASSVEEYTSLVDGYGYKRGSVEADGPRDELYQSKSCHL